MVSFLALKKGLKGKEIMYVSVYCMLIASQYPVATVHSQVSV